MQALILGSSSPFRAELLNKLGLPFSQISPEIDESPLADETPQQLVERLARLKAQEIAKTNNDALIIGSDQVAVIDGEILGKPGNHANAIQQLQKASGKHVMFFTGLALLNAKNQQLQTCVEPFSVHFRKLTTQQIEFYLHKEQPYQCAGSFKSEGFGISLFSRMDGADPNSLIGLPLIQLVNMLNNAGVDVLQPQA